MLLENISLNMKLVSKGVYLNLWMGGLLPYFGNTHVHGTYLPLNSLKQLKCLYRQMTSSLDMFDFFSKYWQDLSKERIIHLMDFAKTYQKITYVVRGVVPTPPAVVNNGLAMSL